jgi:cell division GTPase FtsZ
MKLAVIGVGNAGGKIADRLLEFEVSTGRALTRSVTAINSARIDLARIEYIPRENRHLIGQTDERAKGHGVGGDPDLGAEITKRDKFELDRALDNVPVYDIDAFLVIAGLGGGTGSGGGPTLVRQLRELYEEPIYGLGVLPSTAEGGRAALNAARSFQAFATATDNLIVFDNNAWRGNEDSIETGYDRTNREIAKRVVTLLSAGEIDGSKVSENAMDSSDIRRTLATGGISTIAYAEADPRDAIDRPRGLLERFSFNGHVDPDRQIDPATKVSGLIRHAVRSRLTCPAEIDSAERTLAVISGPPNEFSRKGLESGRQWLETQTQSVEVLAGDDPRENADTLSAVVLLSGVTEVPRINQLQEQAVDAQENIREQEVLRQDATKRLITDEHDELEPL